MSSNPAKRLLEDFRARREDKNKRKRESKVAAPLTSKGTVTAFREDENPGKNLNQSVGIPLEVLNMSSDNATNNGTGTEEVTDGPGPAIEESLETLPTTTYDPAKAEAVCEPVKIKKPSRHTVQKTDNSAKVTADSERAQAEAEAAGVHVRDFATGYTTDLSGDFEI